MAVLRDVWANYRDESFILQFLSPRLIRQFGLFHVLDDASEPNLRVQAIHDERGYRKIQRALARQYDVAWNTPDIQVVDVNLAGDRRLIVHHRALNRVLLEERDARLVLQHLADLWGYDVLLKEIDPATDAVLKEHAATPRAGSCRSGNVTPPPLVPRDGHASPFGPDECDAKGPGRSAGALCNSHQAQRLRRAPMRGVSGRCRPNHRRRQPHPQRLPDCRSQHAG